MISNRKMQDRIVLAGVRPRARLILDQVKAPSTPKVVAMTLIRDRAAGFIDRVVLAKRMAVPETVAMASEIRNQAARKRRTSLRWRARAIVRPRFFQE